MLTRNTPLKHDRREDPIRPPLENTATPAPAVESDHANSPEISIATSSSIRNTAVGTPCRHTKKRRGDPPHEGRYFFSLSSHALRGGETGELPPRRGESTPAGVTARARNNNNRSPPPPRPTEKRNNFAEEPQPTPARPAVGTGERNPTLFVSSIGNCRAESPGGMFPVKNKEGLGAAQRHGRYRYC